MHRFDRFATLFAAADVGLVGDHDQQEVRCLKPCAAGSNVVMKLEISNTRRRIGMTVPNKRPIEHPIAIKEDCASRYFMLSHFVSATFSPG